MICRLDGRRWLTPELAQWMFDRERWRAENGHTKRIEADHQREGCREPNRQRWFASMLAGEVPRGMNDGTTDDPVHISGMGEERH